jgi:DNA-binding SARP family transcriptional activator/TolB-like protein/tetratricopeptide (TPR) repeat protein
MEASVETDPSGRAVASSWEVRLLGPLSVRRDGAAVTLPKSRKVRALFAYLALSPRPVTRGALCELLWDVPDDPRGELRWCLSKLRGIVDTPPHSRVVTRDDSVSLDLSDGFIDALDVAQATQFGLEAAPLERLRDLAALFAGDLLEGLEIDRSPSFSQWLLGQRRRFRGCRIAVIERLVACAPEAERLGHIETWVELAPFDRTVHGLLVEALARRGRFAEVDQHLATTAELFEAEGLDALSIPSRPPPSPGETVAASNEPTHLAPARTAMPDGKLPQEQPSMTTAARRASIAVMPFLDQAPSSAAPGNLATALAHDVITRLAKLRSLFVIAQGSVFALHERRIGAHEAAGMLSVDYVVSGSIRQTGQRLSVAVDLVETRSARILWAESFGGSLDDAFLVLDEIGDRIVASIANEIETTERNRAILRPPSCLDAWEAHHRGLWHAYRFNPRDNEAARHFFETAVSLDPTFSRAFAGLSFTHFQSAFQGWAERDRQIEQAYEFAGRSLMADDRDPAAHWAMGRALWLRGRHASAIEELETSVELSPNFAQGHYSLSFIQSQDGDPAAAIASSDHSRRLSPFDPLLFGMLGARAMALVRLGRYEEAADWGVRAASRPNAHAQILAIAAFSLSLAGRLEEARLHLSKIHETLPHYGVNDFLTAMQFTPEAEQIFRGAAARIAAALA